MQNAGEPKKTWHIITSVIKRNDRRVIPDQEAITVDDFNKYFTAVARDLVRNLSSGPPVSPTRTTVHDCANSFTLFPFTYEEVCSVVKTLKTTSSAGIDGISVSLIKNNFDILGDTLTRLYNHSLAVATYPDIESRQSCAHL